MANGTPTRLSKILVEIHNRLIIWIGLLTVITVAFVICLVIDKSQSAVAKSKFLEFSTGNYNETFFNIWGLGTLSVISIFGIVALAMLGGYRMQTESPLEKWQLQIYIVVSVVLVVIYIFLTGGLLDSPFTPALSIYIGCFLILQERTDTKGFNKFLVFLATLLIFAPYAWLYFTDREMFFFSWRTEERTLTLIRFLIVCIITGFSIWQADKINKKIESIGSTV